MIQHSSEWLSKLGRFALWSMLFALSLAWANDIQGPMRKHSRIDTLLQPNGDVICQHVESDSFVIGNFQLGEPTFAPILGHWQFSRETQQLAQWTLVGSSVQPVDHQCSLDHLLTEEIEQFPTNHSITSSITTTRDWTLDLTLEFPFQISLRTAIFYLLITSFLILGISEKKPGLPNIRLSHLARFRNLLTFGGLLCFNIAWLAISNSVLSLFVPMSKIELFEFSWKFSSSEPVRSWKEIFAYILSNTYTISILVINLAIFIWFGRYLAANNLGSDQSGSSPRPFVRSLLWGLLYWAVLAVVLTISSIILGWLSDQLYAYVLDAPDIVFTILSLFISGTLTCFACTVWAKFFARQFDPQAAQIDQP